MPRALSSSHANWVMSQFASYDPYGGSYSGYPTRHVGQTMYYHPSFISDPEIRPAFIGDPGLHYPSYIAPRFVLPTPAPELYRFVTFGSNGFIPAPLPAWAPSWAKNGGELCMALTALRVTYPAAVLYLVSSTRGWLSASGAVADVWFAFLACPHITDQQGH